MGRLAIVVMVVFGTAGCGDDTTTDGGTGDGYRCGMEQCAIGTEACIIRSLAPAGCEPVVGAGLEGIERCRAHVDAYCGGSGERCDEGSDDAGDLPGGAYRVLCR